MMAGAAADGRSHDAHSAGGDNSPGVYCSAGVLRLVDPALFNNLESDLCRRFLERVFQIEEVRSVEVDPDRAAAVIHYAARLVGEGEMIESPGRCAPGRDGSSR